MGSGADAETVMKTQVPKLLEGLGKDQVWGLPGANNRGRFPILCLDGDGGSGVTWASEELSRGGQLTPPCPLLSSHLLLEQWVACHLQGQPGGGAQLKPVGRMTNTLEFIRAKMCVLSHSFPSFNTCSASTRSQHCSRSLGNQRRKNNPVRPVYPPRFHSSEEADGGDGRRGGGDDKVTGWF